MYTRALAGTDSDKGRESLGLKAPGHLVVRSVDGAHECDEGRAPVKTVARAVQPSAHAPRARARPSAHARSRPPGRSRAAPATRCVRLPPDARASGRYWPLKLESPSGRPCSMMLPSCPWEGSRRRCATLIASPSCTTMSHEVPLAALPPAVPHALQAWLCK